MQSARSGPFARQQDRSDLHRTTRLASFPLFDTKTASFHLAPTYSRGEHGKNTANELVPASIAEPDGYPRLCCCRITSRTANG
jgi:hypothetical protein